MKRVIAALLVLSACGRINFDSLRDATAGDDGGGGDDSAVGSDGPASDPSTTNVSEMLNNTVTQTGVGLPSDLAHSALFFTTTSASANANDALVCGKLAPQGYAFQRGAGGGDVPIEASIVTWSGWTVQRGEDALPSNQLVANVTIAPVDVAHSFPIISTRVDSGTYGNDDTVRVEILDATTLRFTRRTPTTASSTVCWQVITIPDAEVDPGTATLLDTEPMKTVTHGYTVDPQRTFVVFTTASDSAFSAAALLLEGEIQGPNDVFFARRDPTGTVDITYYLVQLANGQVISAGYAWAASESDALVGVPVGGAAAFPYFAGATSNTTTDSIPGRAWSTVKLSASGVVLHRDPTVDTAISNTYWQTIDLVP